MRASGRSGLFLYVEPLTRPSATLSPLTRGEGQLTREWRFVALLPACGEKVPEGRMRATHRFNFDGTLTSHAADRRSRESFEDVLLQCAVERWRDPLVFVSPAPSCGVCA